MYHFSISFSFVHITILWDVKGKIFSTLFCLIQRVAEKAPTSQLIALNTNLLSGLINFGAERFLSLKKRIYVYSTISLNKY